MPGEWGPGRVMRLGPLPGMLALVLSLAACNYDRPLSVPVPAPGTRLGLALTDSGTDRLWRYLGPDIGTVRGRLLAWDDTSIVLAVDAVDMRHGQTLSWKGERVLISRMLVAHVTERQMSIGRTVLAGGFSAVGFIIAMEAFKGSGIGAGSGSGGGANR